MFRLLIKIFLFLFVLILISGISKSFLPAYWGNEVIYDKFKKLNLEKNINTVFIGTSRVHCHADPNSYDKRVEGSKSFNVASPGASGLETLGIVREIIDGPEYDGIKTIYVEMPSFNTPPMENYMSARATYFYDSKRMYHDFMYQQNRPYSIWAKLKSIKDMLYLSAKNSLNIGLYERIQFVYSDILFDTNKVSPAVKKGFNPLNKTAEKYGPIKTRLQYARKYYAAYENGTQRKENNFLTKALQREIIHAEKNGVRLIYMLLPKIPFSKYQDNYPSFVALDTRHKINLSHPSEYPEFYELKYSADKAHLNKNGAALFTDALSEYYRKSQ